MQLRLSMNAFQKIVSRKLFRNHSTIKPRVPTFGADKQGEDRQLPENVCTTEVYSRRSLILEGTISEVACLKLLQKATAVAAPLMQLSSQNQSFHSPLGGTGGLGRKVRVRSSSLRLPPPNHCRTATSITLLGSLVKC